MSKTKKTLGEKNIETRNIKFKKQILDKTTLMQINLN